MHALAGGHLEQVEDQVAVAPAVPEDRHRAEVEAAGREPQQVRGDPVELHVRDAQVLRARRDVDLEQRLDGPDVGHRVEVVREVVHPLDERDDLPVGLVFAVLLDAGVHVADDRLDVAHDLALERRDQPQHAVRGRVVRAEVERQQLVVLGVLDVGELDARLHLPVRHARGSRSGRACASRRSLPPPRVLRLVVREEDLLAAHREVAPLREARRSPRASGSGAGPGDRRRSRRTCRRPRAPGGRRSASRRRRSARCGASSGTRSLTVIRSTSCMSSSS